MLTKNVGVYSAGNMLTKYSIFTVQVIFLKKLDIYSAGIICKKK